MTKLNTIIIFLLLICISVPTYSVFGQCSCPAGQVEVSIHVYGDTFVDTEGTLSATVGGVGVTLTNDQTAATDGSFEATTSNRWHTFSAGCHPVGSNVVVTYDDTFGDGIGATTGGSNIFLFFDGNLSAEYDTGSTGVSTFSTPGDATVSNCPFPDNGDCSDPGGNIEVFAEDLTANPGIGVAGTNDGWNIIDSYQPLTQCATWVATRESAIIFRAGAGLESPNNGNCNFDSRSIEIFDNTCSPLASVTTQPASTLQYDNFVIGETYVICVSIGYDPSDFPNSDCWATEINMGISPQAPLVCPATDYDYTAPSSVCSGEAIDFIQNVACAGADADFDIDLYYYDDGSTFEAPGGYDPFANIAGTNDPPFPSATTSDFPFDDPNLTYSTSTNYASGLGGCGDLQDGGFTNNTCSPYIVSFFTIIWDRQFDTDGDDSFGEYNSTNNCSVMRYDVTIYPAPLTVVETDDGSTCGTPAVELQDGDGDVCSSFTGIGSNVTNATACANNTDQLMYDFSADPIITALAGAPAGCVAPATLSGTITCAACGTCPTVTEVDAADDVCTGALGTAITDWQAAVEADATNAAAIADPNNTDNAVIYSMSTTATEASPPVAGTADGVHSGVDNCATETQTTFAYLLCFGADQAAGGGDDTYLLLGTHTLTVYPDFDASLLTIVMGDCATAPSVTSACANYTITLDGDADDITGIPSTGESGTNNYTITWTGAPACWGGTAEAAYDCPCNANNGTLRGPTPTPPLAPRPDNQ